MKNNDGEIVKALFRAASVGNKPIYQLKSLKVESSAFQVQADGTVVTRGSVTPTCPEPQAKSSSGFEDKA